ncbi:DUF2914 domain-containing protein [Ectothiorhodospiraceae bacterium WFHF3C12]|nr:DUF2914 domain-containing protein [Ectothiorhodospiraceae bacterium WFHF3C12]
MPALRALARLRRFRALLPVACFALGVASFLLVDRQARLAGWLAGGMVLGWVWLLGENLFGRLLQRLFGYRFPPALMRFAVQAVHQETFFFVLPFFAMTTTWLSGQAVFTGVLAGAGLVSIVDPVYFGRLARRRWLYLLFHAFAVFAITLTALPILLELNTRQSYLIAVVATLVFAMPSVWSLLPSQAWYRWVLLLSVLIAFGGGLWLLRIWVPPATLWLTEMAVTPVLNVDRREPIAPMSTVTQTTLRERGLYAYTAIRAPRGLGEDVFHVWHHDGRVIDRIRLHIEGGREAGYRAWTHKRHFPAEAAGRWKVQVITEGGQLIGVLRFTVEAMSGPG